MSTISSAIKEDHHTLERYYKEIISSIAHQQLIGDKFTWELVFHTVAEEMIVLPAFKDHLGKKGHKMAEERHKEHEGIKKLLAEFHNMHVESANYVLKLKELWAVLPQHIKKEEEQDLPALESALKSVESEKMAKRFGLAKALIPSQEHPSAGEDPDSPLVPSAPIDPSHIADIFRKYLENLMSDTITK